MLHNRRIARIPLVLFTLATLSMLLTACGASGGDGGGGTPAADPVISGSLLVASSETSASVSEAQGGALPRLSETESDASLRQQAILDELDDPRVRFVPGDVIVAFEPGVRAASASTLQAAGVTLQVVRDLPVPGARLLHADVDEDATVELIRALAARPDVRYAEPNLLLSTQRVPNDTLWVSDRSYFWHYDQIGLPAAWDTTTGSASTVIGVIDTGILYDLDDTSPAVSHPDFAGKVLPGRDMITNPASALDGDGRDDDAYDVGDVPVGSGQPSYHGTHVAGTIAAATDNADGMPAVDWNAKILPIRALGYDPDTGGGSGSLVDIIDGVYWAAGLGSPSNPNPADVLNLSLGGYGTCGSYQQDAFDAVTAAGVVTVVAAGNEDVDAGNFTPASCRNVITVGATNLSGDRAFYSNYGARIDVMAPGGDTTVDANGDGLVDGVVSALAERDALGNLTMGFVAYQGTSMAAPHVAGVVGLMKALDPGITFAEAEAILVATANPLTAGECGTFLASDCGGGLIDAPAALQAVLDGDVPEPDPEPTPVTFVFTPNRLDFGSDLTTLDVTVTNEGSEAVTWQAGYVEDETNPAPLEEGWVEMMPTGTLAAGASATLTVVVDRTFIDGFGSFAADIVFYDPEAFEEYGAFTILVSKPEAEANPTGPTYVFAYRLVPGSDPPEWRESGDAYGASFAPNYQLSATPGVTYVAAVVDQNANEFIDAGDFIGSTEVFDAQAGGTYPNKDVLLDRLVTGPTGLEGVSIDELLTHPALRHDLREWLLDPATE